jgi:hypothetical protein
VVIARSCVLKRCDCRIVAVGANLYASAAKSFLGGKRGPVRNAITGTIKYVLALTFVRYAQINVI